MDHRSSCSRKTSNKSCRCRAGAVAALDRRRLRRIELAQGRLDGLAEVAVRRARGRSREAREAPLGGAHRLLLRVQLLAQLERLRGRLVARRRRTRRLQLRQQRRDGLAVSRVHIRRLMLHAGCCFLVESTVSITRGLRLGFTCSTPRVLTPRVLIRLVLTFVLIRLTGSRSNPHRPPAPPLSPKWRRCPTPRLRDATCHTRRTR